MLSKNDVLKDVGVVSVFALALGAYISFTTEQNVQSIQSQSFQEEITPELIAQTIKQEQTKVVAKPAPVVQNAAAPKAEKIKKSETNSFPAYHGALDITMAKDKRQVRMNSDVTCLAVNAYFENRSRSDATLERTMWTVKNRVGRYYNASICDAVLNAQYDAKTGKPLKDSAHYSWVADGKQKLVIGGNSADDVRWESAVKIAKKVAVAPKSEDPTKGATHYHTSDTTAWWAPYMTYMGEFDGNKYYNGY